MENQIAFEDGLIIKCFDSLCELKKLSGVRRNTGFLGVPTEEEKISSKPMIKAGITAYEELIKLVEALRGCETNKIARLLRKHKLNNDEAMTVLALCYEMYNGRVSLNIGALARMLSNQNPVLFFEKMKLIKPNSRLLKSGLIELDAFLGDSAKFLTDHHLSLSRLAVRKILGVKKSRVRKPVVKEPVPTGLTYETLKSPTQLYEELSKRIIGQEEAKKAVAVAVYNHYSRTSKVALGLKVLAGKSNMMLLGPTGCGKTFMCKTLAKLLNVPFAVIDATSITKTGYVGGQVEDCLEKLYEAAGKDMQIAEKGIIYIDEIDKLAAHNVDGGLDVSGKGVQQDLLKILEANVVRPVGRSKFMPPMDTSNILFIVGGAFAGIEEIIENRRKNRTFGFKSPEGTPETASTVEVTTEDLISYGLMPEFVGRLPITVQLHELTTDELVEILKNKHGLLGEYISLFKENNIDLTFSEDAIRNIAREAKEKNVGARGLRKIMENLLKPHMFKMFSKGNSLTLMEITKDGVEICAEAENPVQLNLKFSE